MFSSLSQRRFFADLGQIANGRDAPRSHHYSSDRSFRILSEVRIQPLRDFSPSQFPLRVKRPGLAPGFSLGPFLFQSRTAQLAELAIGRTDALPRSDSHSQRRGLWIFGEIRIVLLGERLPAPTVGVVKFLSVAKSFDAERALLSHPLFLLRDTVARGFRGCFDSDLRRGGEPKFGTHGRARQLRVIAHRSARQLSQTVWSKLSGGIRLRFF